MRQVEMRTILKASGGNSAGTDDSAKGGSALSAEDRKNLQRTVQKSEKRIEELESMLKTIETTMADADFYGKPEADQVLKKYNAHKTELEQVMAEWEVAVGKLD